MSDAGFYFAALKEADRSHRAEVRELVAAALREYPRLTARVQAAGFTLVYEHCGRLWTLARDFSPVLTWKPKEAGVRFGSLPAPGYVPSVAEFERVLEVVLDLAARGKPLTRDAYQRAAEAHDLVARFDAAGPPETVLCWPTGGRGKPGIRPVRAAVVGRGYLRDGRPEVMIRIAGQERAVSLRQVEIPHAPRP
ncbi:MAG TPA: hypothetical protein PKA64_00805 [Myxococcota bacterium]|nr:hypothetical protein [Myxococcota bacterium]